MTTIAQPAAKKKINYRSRGKLIIHIILIIGSFVMIFPFVWMILTSFKSNGESLLIPPTFLPREWLVENYTEVTRTLPFGTTYLYSYQKSQMSPSKYKARVLSRGIPSRKRTKRSSLPAGSFTSRPRWTSETK